MLVGKPDGESLSIKRDLSIGRDFSFPLSFCHKNEDSVELKVTRIPLSIGASELRKYLNTLSALMSFNGKVVIIKVRLPPQSRL